MITIQNIGKIIGKVLPISNTKMHTLAMMRIEDVYGMGDTYAFRIKVETPKDTKHYTLKLNREKIQHPHHLLGYECWELRCEERPNQLVVEVLDKKDLKDMGEVIRKISNLMDRILTR
jgi:phosphoribosyl 1,2-cyclic phosphodiesterase